MRSRGSRTFPRHHISVRKRRADWLHAYKARPQVRIIIRGRVRVRSRCTRRVGVREKHIIGFVASLTLVILVNVAANMDVSMHRHNTAVAAVFAYRLSCHYRCHTSSLARVVVFVNHARLFPRPVSQPVPADCSAVAALHTLRITCALSSLRHRASAADRTPVMHSAPFPQ